MTSEETSPVETEEFTYPELPEETESTPSETETATEEYEYVDLPEDASLPSDAVEATPETEEADTSVEEDTDKSDETEQTYSSDTEILNAVEKDDEPEEEDSYDFDELDPPSAEEIQNSQEQRGKVSLDDFVKEVTAEKNNKTAALDEDADESEDRPESDEGNILSDDEKQSLVADLEEPSSETEEIAAPLMPKDTVYSADDLETVEDNDLPEGIEEIAPPLEGIAPETTVEPKEESVEIADTSETDVTEAPAADAETETKEESLADAEIDEATQEESDPEEDSDTLEKPAETIDEAADEAAKAEQTDASQEEAIREEEAVDEVDEQAEEAEQAAVDDVAENEGDPATEAESVSDTATSEETAPETVDTSVPADATAVFAFTEADGFKTFTATADCSVVKLTTNVLSHWMLAVNEISVSPIEAPAEQEIPLSDQMYCQGAFVDANGIVAPFANTAAVAVPAMTQDAMQKLTMILSGLSIMPLTGQAGQVVALDGANGILISTDGAVLFFAGVTQLDLTDATETADIPEKQAAQDAPAHGDAPVATPTAIPAYAFAEMKPPVDDAYIFSPASQNAEIDGEKQSPHVLIKAEAPLYGWTVAFDNGTKMSLSDVRVYQQMNGRLPETSGTVSFGDKTLAFKNISDIKVFEVPAYCGYGILPS